MAAAKPLNKITFKLYGGNSFIALEHFTEIACGTKSGFGCNLLNGHGCAGKKLFGNLNAAFGSIFHRPGMKHGAEEKTQMLLAHTAVAA